MPCGPARLGTAGFQPPRTDGEFGSLLLRRHTVLAALRQRGRPPQPESARTLELAAKVEHLERALATRTVIGQASGILIERHNMTADDAFRMLVAASSVTNRKLRDIAADLVHTGELPGPPDEPSPDTCNSGAVNDLVSCASVTGAAATGQRPRPSPSSGVRWPEAPAQAR